MKTITELQELADKIDNLIKTTINSNNSETFPILDGIIDINKYFNCKFKILVSCVTSLWYIFHCMGGKKNPKRKIRKRLTSNSLCHC